MIAWATYPYTGRVVLVTGAGSGIGRAIARAFLEQGACVAALGRSPEPLNESVAGFDANQTMVIPTDITDPAALTAAVTATRERFGRLDVVIANAGTSAPSTIDTFDDAAWAEMRSINVDSMIRLARLTVPMLRESRGNFLAVSSVAGLGGDWNQFAYNATEYAVNGLVQSLALDRVAVPEDIARAALFLAGPDAEYITGVVLPVDGGTTASSGTPRPLP